MIRKLYSFLLLFCLVVPLHAQVNTQIKFNTGNVELDADLNEINVRARADFGKFKVELGTAYNVPEKQIDHYYNDLQMEPADIYFALEVSSVSGRPVDEVVEGYREDRSGGWGNIAKHHGIKPGSAEFHQLKSRVRHRCGHDDDQNQNDSDKPRHGKAKGKDKHNNGKHNGKH